MSGLADKTEYMHEIYGTARATIKLASGPIEISTITSPDEFATDREITQAEYETIRGCLGQMVDNAMMQSDPRCLAKPKTDSGYRNWFKCHGCGTEYAISDGIRSPRGCANVSCVHPDIHVHSGRDGEIPTDAYVRIKSVRL